MTLEERVATLETELATLKQNRTCNGDSADWVADLSGSLKDYPEWMEIVRIGRELCEEEAGYGNYLNASRRHL
jgi:hypothetical protein